MNPRRPGSVRFDPYWKIQYWDDLSIAWRDVQMSFVSPSTAIAAAPGEVPVKARFRLMEVRPDGRTPYDIEWLGEDEFRLVPAVIA